MQPYFVVLTSAILMIPLVLAGQNSCASEGQEQYVGNIFYKCVNGSLTPIACASETGKKIAVGDAFETSNYEMKCTQTLNNWIQPEIVACLLNGKKVGVGESLSDESFSYTCTAAVANQTVNMQLTGCVDDSGKTVKSGDSFRSGNFLFKCSIDADGSVSIRGAGCILPSDQNGTNVQLAVGEEHMEDAFYYVCREQKNAEGYYGVERHIAGCVYDGKKVEVGQRYTSKGYVYQCQQLEHGHISHAVVGCVSDAGQEYLINGTWVEGQAPLKYVMQCGSDGRLTMKNIVQCSYESSEGRAVLEPGCSKKVGSLLVQCLRHGVNGISYRTAPANGNNTEGLKMC